MFDRFVAQAGRENFATTETGRILRTVFERVGGVNQGKGRSKGPGKGRGLSPDDPPSGRGLSPYDPLPSPRIPLDPRARTRLSTSTSTI